MGFFIRIWEFFMAVIIFFSSIFNFSWLRPVEPPVEEPDPGIGENVFFDDFENGIDPEIWMIAKNQFGGIEAENTGLIPENVRTENGNVKIAVLGDLYEGPKRGMMRDGDYNLVRADTGKRSGGCIVTRAKYASGSYEVRAKLFDASGVSNAFWTFFYDNGRNHEIDWETPSEGPNGAGTHHIMTNTWTYENALSTKTIDTREILGTEKGIADGEWHTFRFDWHTDRANPRVEFYLDDIHVHTSYENIPTLAGRFWLGVFTKNWAGEPNFVEGEMEIDWVKITPFNENGDENIDYPISPREWADLSEYPENR